MNEATAKQYVQQDFGPLDALLKDPDVMEIMVNSYQQIFIEKRGQLIEVQDSFRDEDHLLEIIQNIARPLGRKLDESNPILDLRLPDSSRVHIVGRPIALAGPTMNIRKFPKQHLTTDDLIGFGSWNKDIVDFIRACVLARRNILIMGGNGSGKTTVQNLVAQMIPDEERIVTVEHTNELRLTKKHMVALEGRPPNLEGQGEVTMKQLVDAATKMRPDRIIAGEVHGGEVYPLVLAMNRGIDGIIFSMYSTSVRDALVRLEIMMNEGNPAVPLLATREQLATALDVVVSQQRLRDGGRRVVSVTEVVGLEGGMIKTQDIFEFRQTGFENGKIDGYFTATGIVPTFFDLLQDIPESVFTPTTG